MDVVVQSGQTLADVAIQEYGCLEAVVTLALDNDKSVSQELQAGEQLILHSRIYNKFLATFCKVNGIAPATSSQGNGTTRQGIFNATFNSVFK